MADSLLIKSIGNGLDHQLWIVLLSVWPFDIVYIYIYCGFPHITLIHTELHNTHNTLWKAMVVYYDLSWRTAVCKGKTLQWRHNGLSNYHPHDCLLNRLFGRRSKKTSKFRVTGLCEGNSTVTGEFPARRASNVSTWWRHHENNHFSLKWTHSNHILY